MKQTSEAAFEAALEAVLLADGYLPSSGFERERMGLPRKGGGMSHVAHGAKVTLQIQVFVS